jgi:uncharacterized protein (DUF2236 family)
VSIPDSLLDPVRRQVGHAVRTRVAGDDPRAASEQIWGVPGPRWFTPADPIWIVHGDASMFVAGIRALLLQSLHPLAMAGVAGHSGFRGDPWGRLQRTSRFIATTTYGAIPEAERLIARIRGIHRRVVGTAEDGRPYAASDPRLLRWVHVAEADSFLTAYQRLSPTPLDDASADTYVAQIGSIAERLGVADPPRTVKGLAATIDSYREELEATPAALDAAQFLLHDPPLRRAGRTGYAPLAVGAVALTPPWARAMLHLAGPDILHRSVGIRVGRAAAGLIRWGLTHPEVLAQRQVATR